MNSFIGPATAIPPFHVTSHSVVPSSGLSDIEIGNRYAHAKFTGQTERTINSILKDNESLFVVCSIVALFIYAAK